MDRKKTKKGKEIKAWAVIVCKGGLLTGICQNYFVYADKERAGLTAKNIFRGEVVPCKITLTL